MFFNKDFKYDLLLGEMAEGYLGDLLSLKKIEVKMDFQTHRTGNFFIEYEYRGRPSGIETTEADYWCLIAATKEAAIKRNNLESLSSSDVLYLVILPTAKLKAKCLDIKASRSIKGGADLASKGVLLRMITN